MNPFYRPEHEPFRELIRRFVDKELAPHVEEWERGGALPPWLHEQAGSLGLLGIGFPADYGGLGRLDARLRFLLMQELTRSGSTGLVAGLVGSFYISQPPILALGSDELKRRVLPETISGRKIGALAITEPGAGSDVGAIATRAVRDGDVYVINGSKTFITSGMRAHYLTVAARTGGPGLGGISLLLVDGDNPGLSRTPLEKMGWWCSDTATLYFDDCRVPAGNLLGPENEGFGAIVRNFNAERMDLVAIALAAARLCVDRALEYARDRQTFGRRLADHQVIRHKLVDMDRQVNAAQAWAELLAWRLDQGDSPVAEICEAKVQATLTFEFCAREAAQILGGASYLRGEVVERLYREVRVLAIGGGSEEIMRDLAARQLGI